MQRTGGQPVDTGAVARTYPFSAGTLVIEGGVPFGLAAAAPVTFTTAAPRNKNRHCCWYGTSGAGKGYNLRVLLSRTFALMACTVNDWPRGRRPVRFVCADPSPCDPHWTAWSLRPVHVPYDGHRRGRRRPRHNDRRRPARRASRAAPPTNEVGRAATTLECAGRRHATCPEDPRFVALYGPEQRPVWPCARA
jgi:hypothetical protein